MKGINKVILIGNLGQDPEIRYTSGGMAIATLSLATSESWRDKQTGEQKERTEWHRVVLVGKLAEVAGQYLKKGSQVYVEGKLQTRKWQDQSGQDRYTTEVQVDSFTGVLQMLGGKPQQGSSQKAQPQPPASPAATPSAGQQSNEPPFDYDDDLPF